jgi:hypothetical protein
LFHESVSVSRQREALSRLVDRAVVVVVFVVDVLVLVVVVVVPVVGRLAARLCW